MLPRVAEGHTVREVAQHLGISPKTADHHRPRVMDKLNLHDIQGPTRLALRRGLVTE